jgi:hypothetical protein
MRRRDAAKACNRSPLHLGWVVHFFFISFFFYIPLAFRLRLRSTQAPHYLRLQTNISSWTRVSDVLR